VAASEASIVVISREMRIFAPHGRTANGAGSCVRLAMRRKRVGCNSRPDG
jgi:hypothetical protein